MEEKVQIKNSTLSVKKCDITDTEIDAIVFYARDDLKLGSGFGNAISLRGGPSIRKELENIGPLKVTEAVITTAGNMKAKYIIHANGPKFNEPDTDKKLKQTIENALKIAESNGIERIAFPPMGAGFYGVSLDVSARVTTETITEYLKNETEIKDVVICASDTREYKPLHEQLKKLSN
jgi:O-acetyl-ADP-ribose deacetylase (regulator of RNase III)